MAVSWLRLTCTRKVSSFVCADIAPPLIGIVMLSLSIRDSVHCFSSSVPWIALQSTEIAALASVAASDKPEYISQEIL